MNQQQKELENYKAEKFYYTSAMLEEFLESMTYRDHILKAQKELKFRLDMGVKAI